MYKLHQPDTTSSFHDCYYPVKPHAHLNWFLLTSVSHVETKGDDVLSGVNRLLPALAVWLFILISNQSMNIELITYTRFGVGLGFSLVLISLRFQSLGPWQDFFNELHVLALASQACTWVSSQNLHLGLSPSPGTSQSAVFYSSELFHPSSAMKHQHGRCKGRHMPGPRLLKPFNFDDMHSSEW